MATTFADFTLSGIAASNDFIVGYDTATLNGERRWTVGTIANAVSGIINNNFVKKTGDTITGDVNISVLGSGTEGPTLSLSNPVDSVLNTNVAMYLSPNGASDNVRAAAIKSFQFPIAGNYADLRFYTSPSDTPLERMRISSSGEVGINTTTNTSEKLTVVGNISAKGNIYASGQFLFADGTEALPSIANQGDTNNGLYFPATDTLGICTAGVEKMRINSSGSVGFNTKTPQAALHSVGIGYFTDTVMATVPPRAGCNFTVAGRSFTDITIIALSGTTGQVGDATLNLINSDDPTGVDLNKDYSWNIEHDASGGNKGNLDLRFKAKNLADQVTLFKINSSGEVAIGTDFGGGAYLLQLQSDSAGKPSSNTWTIVSDERIKDNIQLADIDRCYEIVDKLPLKRFTLKQDIYSDEQVKDRSKLGWIAQDVKIIFPKAVNSSTKIFTPKGKTEEDAIEIQDCLDLNSDQIYAAMYGALQKVIKLNKEQAESIKYLEARLTSLESK